jgi:hypothetical protein
VAQSATPPTRGLGELRRARAADETTRNLLELLSSKLELCARLPVLELEAAHEGHTTAVEAFRAVAEVERGSIETLKRCLLVELAATSEDARSQGQVLADRRPQ